MQHIPLDTKRTRPCLRAIQASLLSLLCLALSAAQAGTITTVAGRGLGDGGPAVAASLAKPTGVAVDAAGNVYIADPNDLLIRKIDTSGNISSIATNYASTIALDPTGNLYVAQHSSLAKLAPNGNLNVVAGTPDGIASTDTSLPVGDGRAATAAQLYNPHGIAFDSAGNIYVADTNDQRIRKITPAGIISTIAGTGWQGYGGDGASATAATLSFPGGIAMDSAGNLYIADTGSNHIREITTDGNIKTIAGNGTAGYSGDAGPATAAQLSQPNALALDAHGNLYIADTGNNRIRLIKPDGTISTVAGTGQAGANGDGGPATAAQLNGPQSIAIDTAGNLYIADTQNNTVRKVSTSGTITTISGGAPIGDGGAATSALLSNPGAIAYDRAGNLYIADIRHHRIRKVSPNGQISTVAGTGVAGLSGDGGPAINAQLNYPNGIAVDPSGNLYIADSGNRRIRIVSPNGNIRSLSYTNNGNTLTDLPAVALSFDSAGNLFVANEGSTAANGTTTGGTVYEITASGSYAYIAGFYTPGSGYGGDGSLAVSVSLNAPSGIAVDPHGNIYIADTLNNCIRKVDSRGIITTIAGPAQWNNHPPGRAFNGWTLDWPAAMPGYTGDGGPAIAAQMDAPSDLHFDSAGNLYFADTGNSVIRRIDPNGIIMTVAGNSQTGFSGDGGDASKAMLSTPGYIALNNRGGLAISDQGNQRIRVVNGPLTAYSLFAASANYNGPLTGVTITVSMAPASFDLGTTGNEFIAAILPNGSTYLFGANGWQAYDPKAPTAYRTGPLAAYTNVNIVNNINLTSLAGTGIYVGYGRGNTAASSFADMLSQQTYTQVTTVN